MDKNKKQFKMLLGWLLLPMAIILCVSCSKDEEGMDREIVLTTLDEHTSIDEASGVVYVSDLPGSVGNTFASGHIEVFYDLENRRIINPNDGDGKLSELPENEKRGDAWDLAFTSIYNSYIAPNNGVLEDSPGFGGNGQGALVVLDTRFDELDQAPDDAVFDAFMEEQETTGWEDFPPGDKGWYFYSLDSHIMSAISGVTIVVRTPDGRYAKLEMESLYLDSPQNPTVNTPAPYFTFRYFLQEDGSSNLRTR